MRGGGGEVSNTAHADAHPPTHPSLQASKNVKATKRVDKLVSFESATANFKGCPVVFDSTASWEQLRSRSMNGFSLVDDSSKSEDFKHGFEEVGGSVKIY